jgi:hypothetical protein
MLAKRLILGPGHLYHAVWGRLQPIILTCFLSFFFYGRFFLGLFSSPIGYLFVIRAGLPIWQRSIIKEVVIVIICVNLRHDGLFNVLREGCHPWAEVPPPLLP